jgi:AcrR family transcriptional regulator
MGRRDEKKEETQAAILAASLQLFRAKGFRATTMRDIAAEAGIALGTTYNYFPTKEHIALFFFERSMEAVMARYLAEEGADMALEERIFLLLAIELEQIAPYEDFLNLIVVQSATPRSRLSPLSDDSERLKQRYLGFVRGILADARDRGDLPEMPGYDDILLSAYWVFHLGILLFWLNDNSPQKEDTHTVLDKSLRFLLRALRDGNASEASPMPLLSIADSVAVM